MINKGLSIDEKSRQILLPLEFVKQLNLTNFDWLKVNILHDYVALSLPEDRIDEEFISALIHDGILIDPL